MKQLKKINSLENYEGKLIPQLHFNASKSTALATNVMLRLD